MHFKTSMPLFLFLLVHVKDSFGNVLNDGRGLAFNSRANQTLEVDGIQNVTRKIAEVDDKMECVFTCVSYTWCRSVNFKTQPEDNSKHLCELISGDSFSHGSYIKENSSYVYMSIKNPCEDKPCMNGGSCSLDGKIDYHCQCKSGFTGINCPSDIDECKTVTCSNGETCINTVGSYKCVNTLYTKSCLTLYLNQVATQNSVNTLVDVSGNTYEAYCDMTNKGWTLVARFSNADEANWMLDSGESWYDNTTASGQTTRPDVNQDMISPAFWKVTGSQFKITRSDDVSHTALLYTTNSCLNSKTFRAKITSFGNFRNKVVWGTDSCKGNCDVVYGGNYAATDGFQQSSCDGNLQTRNKIGFWCDWSSGDGAVMMIGGGGSACSRADHGIGITEANSANFYDANTGEKDFGREASKSTIATTTYALNLWVK